MSLKTGALVSAILSLAAIVYVACHPSGLSCPTGQAMCGGVCTRVLSDRANCGACGKQCAGGNVCSSGRCALSCQGGLTDCGGTCRNLAGDPDNCGACGAVCTQGQVCSGGACVLSCPPSTVDCGGGCFNLDTNPMNCGRCGITCGQGTVCMGGHCVTTCSNPYSTCGTPGALYCANLTKDSNNCGACGTVCPAGQQCSGSSCACAGATPNACTGTNGAFCTNFNSDGNNCGACGTVCPAGQMCSSGACVETCAMGFTACPANAPATYCADLQNDRNNCNACGTVCPAAASCVAGVCTCPGTETMCTPTRGGPQYCADTSTNPQNCGACNNACPSPPNAMSVCAAAQGCSYVCDPNFLDCNQLATDGCEVDRRSDNNNCGGCGVQCKGSQTCTNGACVNACTGQAAAVDQQQLTGDTTTAGGPVSVGQTFTVGASGRLTGVELGICANAPDAGFAGAGATLTVTRAGTVIATATLPSGIPLCPPAMLSAGTVGSGLFDLTQDCAAVTTGEQLTFTVTTTAYTCDINGCAFTCGGGPQQGMSCFFTSCNYRVSLLSSTTDTYAGGNEIVGGNPQTGIDLSFKTFVVSGP